MKKLRIISTLLIMVLLFGALSISSVHSASSPAISLDNVTVDAGETASVKVTLENNPGIIALRPQINYNDVFFTVNSVVDAKLLKGKMHSNSYKKSPYTLYWYDATSNADNYANGVIATVNFNVPEYTLPGTYDLTLLLKKKDAVKNSLKEIGTSFELVHGSITVNSDVVLEDMDINFDGVVDETDLSLFESYFAGFDVTINEENADVDRDGEISRRDMLLLSQYLELEAQV